MTTFQEELRQLGACHDACEWVGERTREQAWSDCERVDWMLWYAMRAGASHKDVVTCACRFARISLAHTDDPRVLACIETVEAWVRGEATDADVVAARSAASAAAAAYAARSSAYAADSAAYAVAWSAVAWSAAWSAAADSAAADAYAYAADSATDAARSAAYAATRRQCCDIVRDVIQLPER